MRRRHWFRLVAASVAALPLAGCGSERYCSWSGRWQWQTGGDTWCYRRGRRHVGSQDRHPDQRQFPLLGRVRPGLQDAGKELGVRVELVRNDATEGGQIRRLEQLATQGDVKGVGISVLEQDAAGVAEAMQSLRAKGVKVITIDSDGPRGARRLRRHQQPRRGPRTGPPGGTAPAGRWKAVTFVGTTGAQNAKERIGGFKERGRPRFRSSIRWKTASMRPRPATT